MTERILGPTGSPKRRRFLFVPIIMVALLAVFWVAGAQAVHDEFNIQLDGNALTDATPTVGNGTEDWDLICKAHLTTLSPPGECEKNPSVNPSGTTSADSSQFVADSFGAETDDVYSTGGSKDDLDISSWKFKNATPSPDKADLEHAMAALYTDDDRFVYFAADRFSNAGDVNIAFWFFQDEVKQNGNGTNPDGTPNPTLCTSGAGCGFDGVHVEHGPGPDTYICYPGMAGYNAIKTDPTKPDVQCTAFGGPGEDDTRGDILVVSAFTGGGTQPNISIYEWVGLTKAPLLPAQNGLPKKDLKVSSDRSVVAVPTGATLSAGCATTGLASDPACAIVNTGPITAPWTFTDKGTGGSAIEQGEFYEGGLNLTALGFGETCFSSFLVNTRSSQSVDSVLHDFALGKLGNCGATVTTTPQQGGGTAIPTNFDIGTGSRDVRDSALLEVTGVSSYGGTMRFWLCFFGTDTTSLCDGKTQATTGTEIGTAQNVAGSSPETINSEVVTITSAGRYCWRAVYSGDSQKGVPPDEDSSSTECFTVKPVTPTLTTTAVKADGTALGSTAVDFGQPIYDKASLTGTAKQPSTPVFFLASLPTKPTQANAGGTITFHLYGPSATASPSTADCNKPAKDANGVDFPSAGISVTVSGDSTAAGYPAANPSTVTFTPGAPGYYFWKARYSGNSPNTTEAPLDTAGTPPTQNQHNADCSVAAERVQVRQIPTEIRTNQSWYPNDTAQIKSSVTGDNILAGGTVDFFLYANATCTAGTSNANLRYAERVTIAAGNISSGVATVSTKNYPGGAGTAPPNLTWAAFQITTALTDAANSTAGPYSWKVVYTPNSTTDTVHLGRQSACNAADPVSIEKFSITYTNDNSGGTALP